MKRKKFQLGYSPSRYAAIKAGFSDPKTLCGDNKVEQIYQASPAPVPGSPLVPAIPGPAPVPGSPLVPAIPGPAPVPGSPLVPAIPGPGRMSASNKPT